MRRWFGIADILYMLHHVERSLENLHRKVDIHMSSISDSLNEIKSNLDEASTEIVEKLESLDVVSDADKATVAELVDKARALADIVPDDVPEEPETPEEPTPAGP